MSAPDPFARIDASLRRQRPFTRLWVGYSGGLDSHTLLHWLANNGGAGLDLNAVHVDHGIHPSAGQWARHCERTCKELQVPLRVERVTVRAGPEGSPEEAARRARYEALAAFLGWGDILVTAHHLDDQAETVLLQLARGSGIPGLAAMPECAALGKGRLLRPLLGTRRADLLAYARCHELRWIEDPSNDEQSLDRNFFRHQVIPTLSKRWPAFPRNVARSARHCAEARTLLNELAAQDQEIVKEPGNDALRIGPLLNLSAARQRNLIRYWIGSLDLPIPAAKHLDELFRGLVHARPGAQPCCRWPGVEVRRHRDAIHAMAPLPGVPRHWRVPIGPGARIEVPGGGTVELLRDPSGEISAEAIWGKDMEVGFRPPGGKLRLRAMGPRRSLKALFREAGTVPWIRERVPVLLADGEVVAVAGYWINADFQAVGGRSGVRLQWQP